VTAVKLDCSETQMSSRVLTDRSIRCSPDCVESGVERSFAVALVSSTKLSHAEKLLVLRRFDQFREWHVLDEKRYFLVCGELITGREIQIIESKGGGISPRLSCPTEHCNSVPMEWVPPSEAVLGFRLVMQQRRAVQSCQRKKGSNTTVKTTLKPPLDPW